MKRTEMIKSKKDFSTMIHSKNFYKSEMFIIYIRKSEYDISHFGIAISKKVGNAVIRNKLKRQIRSIMDMDKFLFPKGFDYIIMIRNKCASAHFGEMKASIEELLKGMEKNEKKA